MAKVAEKCVAEQAQTLPLDRAVHPINAQAGGAFAA